MANSLALVQWLVERNFCPMSDRNMEGNAPISLAAWAGFTDVVRCLLDAGVSIETTNINLSTPLMLAAWGNQLETVQLLHERGALHTPSNESGFTAALGAAHFGHIDAVRLLVCLGSSIREAIVPELDIEAVAQEAGHEQLAQWLHRTKHYTPLHMACESRNVRMATRLLREGADPACVVNGEAPLSVASRQDASPLALPVCRRTQALVRVALEPWSPRSHSLATAQAQHAVANSLHVLLLVREQASLPSLSNELLLKILSYAPCRPVHQAASARR
jgi:ankyrin repeat protein